jgi:hypothetical protein
MMISMEKGVIDYSLKWVGVIFFSIIIRGLKLKKSKWNKDFYNTWSTIRNLKSKVDE